MDITDLVEILQKYPNLKDISSCQTIPVDEVKRALQVYMDLAESKNWWNLDLKACESVHKMLVTGHETQFDPQSIILPVRNDTVFSTEELENLKRNIKGQFDSDSFVLAIVAPDSTVVYYQLSQGLVPPEPPELLEAKRQRRIRYQQRRRQRTMKFNQIADIMAIKSSSSTGKTSVNSPIKSSSSTGKISISSPIKSSIKGKTSTKSPAKSSPAKSSLNKSQSKLTQQILTNAADHIPDSCKNVSIEAKNLTGLHNDVLGVVKIPGSSSTKRSHVNKRHSSLFDTDDIEQASESENNPAASVSNPAASVSNLAACESNPAACESNPAANVSNPAAVESNLTACESNQAACESNPAANASNPAAVESDLTASGSNPAANHSNKNSSSTNSQQENTSSSLFKNFKPQRSSLFNFGDQAKSSCSSSGNSSRISCVLDCSIENNTSSSLFNAENQVESKMDALKNAENQVESKVDALKNAENQVESKMGALKNAENQVESQMDGLVTSNSCNIGTNCSRGNFDCNKEVLNYSNVSSNEQVSDRNNVANDDLSQQNGSKMEIRREFDDGLVISGNINSEAGAKHVIHFPYNCETDCKLNNKSICTENNVSRTRVNCNMVNLNDLNNVNSNSQNVGTNLNYDNNSPNYETTCRNFTSNHDISNAGASNAIGCSDDHVTASDLDSSVEGNHYTVNESSDWFPNMAPEDFESGDYDDEFEGEL